MMNEGQRSGKLRLQELSANESPGMGPLAFSTPSERMLTTDWIDLWMKLWKVHLLSKIVVDFSHLEKFAG